jgi:hypothetical protein
MISFNILLWKERYGTMREEMKVIADDTMRQLLDLYQMNNWGMSWIKFTEIFTEIILLTIGDWQADFEEEEEEE